jgi:hypothetical protein
VKVRILLQKSDQLLYFIRYTPTIKYPNGKQVIYFIGLQFCNNLLYIEKQEFVRDANDYNMDTKWFDIWCDK